jgi:UPF0755 protein
MSRKAKSKKKTPIAGIVVFVLGGLVVFGLWARSLFEPVAPNAQPTAVIIPQGAKLERIGAILQSNGVVRSGTAFRLYARYQGGTEKIRAGRYSLSGSMSLARILQRLTAGPQTDQGIRVTIPEGFTLKQIADTLDDKRITDGKEFLRLATDKATIAKLTADFPLPEKTLEGYLFPDTYRFKSNTSPLKILEEMTANFESRFARPYAQQIADSKRSLHDLVTIASLVEREARVPQDRAPIAGVIVNRLEQNMRLQVDATVLYALGTHKDRVLYKDLEVDSPYNTYRHKGLPPGPIACPGMASLEAALKPTESTSLYYVARADGSHVFTRTLAEHEAAKQRVRAARQRSEGRPGG